MDKIQVIFTSDTPFGKFTDALYLTQEQILNSDIEAMKRERVSNWVASIENPQ